MYFCVVFVLVLCIQQKKETVLCTWTYHFTFSSKCQHLATLIKSQELKKKKWHTEVKSGIITKYSCMHLLIFLSFNCAVYSYLEVRKINQTIFTQREISYVHPENSKINLFLAWMRSTKTLKKLWISEIFHTWVIFPIRWVLSIYLFFICFVCLFLVLRDLENMISGILSFQQSDHLRFQTSTPKIYRKYCCICSVLMVIPEPVSVWFCSFLTGSHSNHYRNWEMWMFVINISFEYADWVRGNFPNVIQEGQLMIGSKTTNRPGSCVPWLWNAYPPLFQIYNLKRKLPLLHITSQKF